MSNQEDHQPFPIAVHRGLFARGARHHVPDGFLTNAKNLTFLAQGQIGSRNKAKTVIEMSGALAGAKIVRYFTYTKIGEVPRFIVLDSTGKFWDVKADNSAPPVNILTVAAAVDFSGLTLYNRFYFMPHDRTTGIATASGGFLYVYDPALSVTARKAAGAKAGSALTLAVSATNGNVEPGFHVMAVSFKTDTGFLTRPAGFASVTAPSGTKKKIDVTNIPLGAGGTGTVARWLWLSKAVKFYDGNLESVPLFFAREINDNSTTSQTGANGVDAFDSQLSSSADKYMFNLEEIPAGVALCDYDGSLVIVGEKSNNSIARVSVVADPEAFNSAEGFVQCAIGDGGGLKNCASSGGVLWLFKSARTHGTRRIVGLPVNQWRPDLIDVGNGAECFGVARVLDSNNPLVCRGLLIQNFAGLHLFQGTFPDFPLSRNIDRLWESALQTASVADYTRSNLTIDPMNKRIYCALGNIFLYCDYRDGMNWESVKWSQWEVPEQPASLQLATEFNFVGREIILYYGNLFGSVGGMTQIRSISSLPVTDTHDTITIGGVVSGPGGPQGDVIEQHLISWEAETAPIRGFENTAQDHIAAVLIDGVINAGKVQLELRDASLIRSSMVEPVIDFADIDDRTGFIPRGADFVSKLITLRLRPTDDGSSFALNQVILYGSPEADMFPK